MLDSTSSVPASPAHSRFDFNALKRDFAEDGYIVLRGVVSRPEAKSVAEHLSAEFEQWRKGAESFQGGGQLSGHLNCYPGLIAKSVVQQLERAGVVELSNKLFPTNPRAQRIGCNFNMPGSAPQHYHMDGIFLQSFMVVNVAVVDTDLNNGAIDVIPKTHKRFYKYWEFATGRVYKDSKRLPLSAGDVLIRTSTLWHRGMPNYSSAPRPMLALTLGERGVDTDDPFAYRDGKVEFQTNWFSTSRLGRLRERTVVAAPVIYSAYRFARSLVGNKGYASF